MDEAKATNKIIVNDTHQKELNYWKKIVLEGKNEKRRSKQLMDLAPWRTFLALKDVVKNEVKIDETIFYLKTQCQPHNPHNHQESIIDDDLNQEDFTFETKSARLKLFSRSAREVENTALKNKVILGGWVSAVAKVFRRDKNRGKDLPDRFEDWMESECGMKKQTIYNY